MFKILGHLPNFLIIVINGDMKYIIERSSVVVVSLPPIRYIEMTEQNLKGRISHLLCPLLGKKLKRHIAFVSFIHSLFILPCV